MSVIVRNCCQSIHRGSPRLLRAFTSINLVRPLNFQHASFGKTNTSKIQLCRYSGMPESPSSLGEPGKPYGEGKKVRHPFAGPAGRIRRAIQEYKHKRWGFLIYRCDYSNDDLWNKFLSNVRHEMEEHLKMLEAEDLRDTMETTIKEDRETLDGATVDQVREIFNKWVKSDEAKAENNNTPYTWLSLFPRYRYCVHVDADVIDSVVNRAPQLPEDDVDHIGYVNLVRLVYVDYIEDMIDEASEYEDDGEDFTKMNDVKAPLSYIGAESYGSLDKDSMWTRYVQYRRADGISCGQ